MLQWKEFHFWIYFPFVFWLKTRERWKKTIKYHLIGIEFIFDSKHFIFRVHTLNKYLNRFQSFSHKRFLPLRTETTQMFNYINHQNLRCTKTRHVLQVYYVGVLLLYAIPVSKVTLHFLLISKLISKIEVPLNSLPPAKKCISNESTPSLNTNSCMK